MSEIIDFFLHLDDHLNHIAGWAGPWTYVILFAIIFAETGLVIMPFLPGDSLLFAVGALAAGDGATISLPLTMLLLTIAAILGDAVNYTIGYHLGPKLLSKEKSRFFNRAHLLKAQSFYEKHGGKTIVLARFVPIVRTFAPFVAGVGRMNYARFALFNISGGVVWVALFCLLGYWFGTLQVVKDHFELVIFAIVGVSVIPMMVELVKARLAAKRGDSPLLEVATIGERVESSETSQPVSK